MTDIKADVSTPDTTNSACDEKLENENDREKAMAGDINIQYSAHDTANSECVERLQKTISELSGLYQVTVIREDDGITKIEVESIQHEHIELV